MFVTTGRVQARTSFDQIAKLLESGMVPILKRAPGFMGYYVIQTDDSSGAGSAVFQSEKDWNAVKDDAISWFEKTVAPLSVGEPLVIAGEVISSTEAEGPQMRTGATPGAEARPH